MPRPSEAVIQRVRNQLRTAGSPCTWEDAVRELGRRGAAKRLYRKRYATTNTQAGRSCLPERDR